MLQSNLNMDPTWAPNTPNMDQTDLTIKQNYLEIATGRNPTPRKNMLMFQLEKMKCVGARENIPFRTHVDCLTRTDIRSLSYIAIAGQICPEIRRKIIFYRKNHFLV